MLYCLQHCSRLERMPSLTTATAGCVPQWLQVSSYGSQKSCMKSHLRTADSGVLHLCIIKACLGTLSPHGCWLCADTAATRLQLIVLHPYSNTIMTWHGALRGTCPEQRLPAGLGAQASAAHERCAWPGRHGSHHGVHLQGLLGRGPGAPVLDPEVQDPPPWPSEPAPWGACCLVVNEPLSDCL